MFHAIGLFHELFSAFAWFHLDNTTCVTFGVLFLISWDSQYGEILSTHMFASTILWLFCCNSIQYPVFLNSTPLFPFKEHKFYPIENHGFYKKEHLCFRMSYCIFGNFSNYIHSDMLKNYCLEHFWQTIRMQIRPTAIPSLLLSFVSKRFTAVLGDLIGYLIRLVKPTHKLFTLQDCNLT